VRSNSFGAGSTGRAQDEGVARQEMLGQGLENRFPSDVVVVTRRGQNGADVRQTVRTGANLSVGTILWEVKWTATWSNDWLAKLKADQQRDGAQIAVIASAALPTGAEPVSRMEGLWVCDLHHAPLLAVALREILVQVAAYERANASRGDAAARVFDYIATGDFSGRISSMIKAISDQRTDSARGQRAMQQFWQAEDTRLRILEAGLASLVGDLLGLGATVSETARFDHLVPRDTEQREAVLPGTRGTTLRRVPFAVAGSTKRVMQVRISGRGRPAESGGQGPSSRTLLPRTPSTGLRS
jgi:hypothetical protein